MNREEPPRRKRDLDSGDTSHKARQFASRSGVAFRILQDARRITTLLPVQVLRMGDPENATPTYRRLEEGLKGTSRASLSTVLRIVARVV